MPLTREITMVVTFNRVPTQEQYLRMGREAAAGLMDRFGAMCQGYTNSDDRIATDVRFNAFTFPSVRYPRELDRREWMMTPEEIEDYEEEDDDF